MERERVKWKSVVGRERGAGRDERRATAKERSRGGCAGVAERGEGRGRIGWGKEIVGEDWGRETARLEAVG